MPSIRSRPEGPKYGEKNLIWILWAASSSYELPALPSPSLHVATPAKGFTATKTKFMSTIEFIFVLKKLLKKFIFKER
jgi:hypothetical protein